MLGKLGLRSEAYPLDFSRCTLDGVIHFVRNGFAQGFYPPGRPPYRPECVGIWVLFRGQHTAFAHFDLNDAAVRQGFDRKMERWDAALDGRLGPLHFFRTVTAVDPRAELDLVPELERALLERCPALDFRVSVVVHDQGMRETTLLQPISERSALWALEYTADASRTLFDRAHDGYQRVVQTAVACDAAGAGAGCADAGTGAGAIAAWPPRPAALPQWRDATQSPPPAGNTVSTFPWRSHDNIALIYGVASVAGTCTGIGSTTAVPVLAPPVPPPPGASGDDGDATHRDSASSAASTASAYPFKCAYCGDARGHPAAASERDRARQSAPFTDDEDEVLVAHLAKILVLGADRVEAIEAVAHELGRGAYEVVCRMQVLTNSSLKLTDGLVDEADHSGGMLQ